MRGCRKEREARESTNRSLQAVEIVREQRKLCVLKYAEGWHPVLRLDVLVVFDPVGERFWGGRQRRRSDRATASHMGEVRSDCAFSGGAADGVTGTAAGINEDLRTLLHIGRAGSGCGRRLGLKPNL